MRPTRYMRRTGALLICTVAGSCNAGPRAEVTPEDRGEVLFAEETFEGNARTCSTCHDLDRFGTIQPASVQRVFAADPDAALFRPIDSDSGLGVTYERLKQHATIRVPMELGTHSTGVSIRRCDAPDETTVFLNRGVPTVFNIALEPFLMHDGREAADLEGQALSAIRTHGQPGRDPTPEELAAIAAFEQSLFSHAALREFRATGTAPVLPEGSTPSEVRGRDFFEPDRQCGICHSGPMLNRTSDFHPATVGGRFETVLVGAEPDNPNEKFDWCFVDPVTNEVAPGPAGDTMVFPAPVSDPGQVIVLGERTFTEQDGTVRAMPSDMMVAEVRLPLFKIPTLWGTPNTAPYFHDNSASDFGDLLDQYNFMFRQLRGFAIAAGCDPEAADCLSEQDMADIISFLQLLSFEGVDDSAEVAVAGQDPGSGSR